MRSLPRSLQQVSEKEEAAFYAGVLAASLVSVIRPNRFYNATVIFRQRRKSATQHGWLFQTIKHKQRMTELMSFFESEQA